MFVPTSLSAPKTYKKEQCLLCEGRMERREKKKEEGLACRVVSI